MNADIKEIYAPGIVIEVRKEKTVDAIVALGKTLGVDRLVTAIEGLIKLRADIARETEPHSNS